MKSLLLMCIVLVSVFNGVAQLSTNVKDTMPQYYGAPVEVYDQNFLNQYRLLKPKVLKVYPYALHAADLLDEMNNNLASIEKRRKRNKYTKKSYNELKDDFKYVLLDMYVSEGKVLMKLIARETGMSVHEIISEYRGAKNAAMFSIMGKMFDQDTKATYDPKKDYVLEAIIKDIESGKIEFDDTVKTSDKKEFKENKKKAKEKRKEREKRLKEKRKEKRKNKRKSNK